METTDRHADRQRTGRGRALAGLVIVGAMLLTACGSDDSGSDDSGSGGGDTEAAGSGVETPEGGWSYVDGSGQETTLDEVPRKVVAHASAAAALIPLGIRPVGIFADVPVEDDLALSQMDLEGIEIVGEEWGVINIEAVAALEPDLIVSEYWPLEEAYTGLEEGTGRASQQLQELAPIVGPVQGPSIETMIEDYEELAASLGADLEDPDIAEARSAFEEARSSFEEAVAAEPELDVLAVSPDTDGLYVAVPEESAELSDFTDWGMNLVVPDSPDEGFEYWETLSWENADKYQADLVIIDERGYPGNLEEAERHPGWSFLDAVEADAVAVWPAYWLRNYQHYAEALEELTEAVEEADPDLVA